MATDLIGSMILAGHLNPSLINYFDRTDYAANW